ncbi:MAG: segregation/condensation protein A [Candidatus Neomarinimicrobiota bacterium]
MAYRIHLENFEGPLDLLLYFIQRDQIDIYDIPIAHITAEYLDYLDLMESLNLSLAGEFILLAATLMHIKVRMLLPRPEPVDDDLIDDPRRELVQLLMEYQQIKAAATELRRLAEDRRTHYSLGMEVASGENGVDPGEYLQDVSLYQLMAVFKEVMDRLPRNEPLKIRPEPIKLDDRIRAIHQAFGSAQRIAFRQVLKGARHVNEVVITFLAVLEMLRQGAIEVEQEGPFTEIYLLRTRPN